MTLKAISLWQPWASLVAIGAKKYETRSWATNYRGPLAVCSTASSPGALFREMMSIHGPTYNALAGARWCAPWPTATPHGSILAVVDLVEIHSTTSGVAPAEELPFGDYSPGRFAWKLANVRRLPEPIPVKGRQGLWTLPSVAEQLVLERVQFSCRDR